MKYLKTFLFTVLSMFLLYLIPITLNYFGVMSNKITNVFNIIILFMACFLSGIVIGKKAINKGYLEGLKIGGMISGSFLLISLLLKNKFTLIKIVFYILIIVISTIGSIIGINKKGK